MGKRQIINLAVWVLCVSLYNLSGAEEAAQVEVKFKRIEFCSPTVKEKYFRIDIPIQVPGDRDLIVKGVSFNDTAIESFSVVDREGKVLPESKIPKGEKEVTVQALFPWLSHTSYKISIELSTGIITAEARAPSEGGYWNSQWRSYQMVLLQEDMDCERVNEVVDISLVCKKEEVRDPRQEVRVMEYSLDGRVKEIPSQVYNETVCDTHISFNVLFLADIKANQSKLYLIAYNNPQATPPTYSTDLKTEGKEYNLTIENPHYKIILHDKSGQIQEIYIKKGSNNKLFFESGPLHWNPDCYDAVKRYWDYTHKWNPPPHYSVETGPIMTMVTRWGPLPTHTQIQAKVTYKFFASQPYIKMSSTLFIKEDLPIIFLRNDEPAFSGGFTDLAWRTRAGKLETVSLIGHKETFLMDMAPDIPWLCFYNKANKDAMGSIRLEFCNLREGEGVVKIHHPNTCIVSGGEKMHYWFRKLIDGDWKNAVVAPAGCIYHEENAYLMYKYVEKGYREMDTYQKLLTNPLLVGF